MAGTLQRMNEMKQLKEKLGLLAPIISEIY